LVATSPFQFNAKITPTFHLQVERGKIKKVIGIIGLIGCLGLGIVVSLFIALIIAVIWWLTRFGV
jgi:hypothetical protein